MTKEIEIPLVKATNENLKGYGYLIDSFENSDIEIVTWPKQGWRDIEEGTGNVSYDAANHQYMTDMRAWKISNIANDIDKLEIHGDESADTLVLGWGSTYGGITQAVNRLNEKGIKVASAHFVHLNPFPDNTLEVISKFKQVIIPELNTGQLLKLVREAFLVDARGINKVTGEPFTAQELTDKIEEIINE